MIWRIGLVVCSISILLAAGCTEEEEEVDHPEEPGEWVAIDLDRYMDDAPDPNGTVSIFQATDESQLIEGEGAKGQVGDYVLENERVRFVVEAGERTMSPCTWGGNIIDTEYRSDDFGGDVFGEVCLMLNGDQTFKPEEYEILHDGSDGAGVLAVTGRTEVLDFLNIGPMLDLVAPGLGGRFELRPDELFPLRITIYYILRPGDLGVRVVTRLRNDGDERLSLFAANLMIGGGDAGYFNPLSATGGFGFDRQIFENLNSRPLPFLALVGDDSATAYVPRPDDRLNADLPVAGGYITIFNIVAVALGHNDVLMTLLATEQQLSNRETAMHIEPGEVEELEHWIFASDGNLSTMIDVIYDELGVETGIVEGAVVGPDEVGLGGARVTAVDGSGRTMNQARTDEDGNYAMALPAGNYEIKARLPGRANLTPPVVPVDADAEVAVDDIVLDEAGEIVVQVRTPDGEPTPARVSLICIDDCPAKATTNEKDTVFDGLPDDFVTVEWAGVSGEVSFAAHPGEYELVVSRGMEWSLWPEGADELGGEVVEVLAGESTSVSAEIAQVLDSSGALSADFHVHAVPSMDSTTPKEDRVLTFLTEGVDVLVSSDHDVIADYGPAAEALGATDHMATIVGSEVTTSVLGHFNGFPLEHDPTSRVGGALDWGGGTGPALSPGEIYDWFESHPGEQVVQLNHPDISFMAYADVLRGKVYGDPDELRLRAPDYDPDTGDLGIWDDGFSAMEVMNGHGMDRVWGVMRWWLTLIGRGETKAGTAVTDTHTRYGDSLGSVPRSFVFVGDDADDPGDFDQDHFVQSVNSAEMIGTNGPFVEVTATNAHGDTAGLGHVLQTEGEAVTVQLRIQVPEWISVDTVELLKNLESVVTEPGEYNTDPIEPTERFEFELTEEHLQVVATGEMEHRRYEKTIEIEIETDVDSYLVFLVRGEEDMYPVVPWTDVEPFAFTNPIYLDVDGDGYSNPPLMELASSDSPSIDHLLYRPDHPDRRELTPAIIREHFENSKVEACH